MARISQRSRVRALTLLGLSTAALARALVRQARRLDLRGRVVVVTGGTRGLGLLLAEEFGRRGAKVAICGRDQAALHDAERRLRGLGIEVLARPADLGERRQAELFVNRVALEWDRIDVLVNNAGVIHVAPAEIMSVESIEEAIRSNYLSAVYMTMAALPHLAERRGEARVVNIVSIGGRVAVPHLLGYSAAKFALMGFSEGLDAELRQQGIEVTTVIPGLMRTGSFYNAEFSGKASREFTWFSVAASAPLLTMNARRAARRVVRAAELGLGQVYLGLPAYVLALIHGVAPRLTVRAMGLVNRFLPRAGEAPGTLQRGRDVGAPIQRSSLLRLGNDAARRNNEVPPTGAR